MRAYRAYRPDPFASTTDFKISLNYKNTTYVAPRSFRAGAYRIWVTNSNSIEPAIEHYACLVDALGRSGRVREAENLILPTPFKALASMYGVLLSACRVQGETETEKRVASPLLALELSDSAANILLSNMHAATNRWDDVSDARKLMKRKNVKMDPSFSWIDVKNKVHLFVVDDKSHP
ncbi:hypothetical protein TorRG33x02_281300 [Trema orientale]|uniref:Pentatricopeptide repeat n=1 Tax=Trema orientale TaxID=63057 RepID=A0A2P5CKS3_TREOI|nr:hypothetical protein TorRG33x02_281300 [Trema orientale]